MTYQDTWNKKLRKLDIKPSIQFSQHNEESIVDALFSVCLPQNKWCLEVGAQDGIDLSNTRKLILNGWKALLIEHEKSFFDKLVENYKYSPNVYPVFKKVGRGYFNDGTGLQEIMKEYSVPLDIDFVSIDVDSYDYELLRCLFNNNIKPNVVCIECNPMEENFTVVNYDPSYSVDKRHISYGGATVGLLNRLAEENGYELVCVDVCNAIYIKKDFAQPLYD